MTHEYQTWEFGLLLKLVLRAPATPLASFANHSWKVSTIKQTVLESRGWGGLTLKRSTFFDEGEDWKEKRFYLLSLSSCVSGFFFSSSGLKIKQINNHLWHQLKNMSKGKKLYTLNKAFFFKVGFTQKKHIFITGLWPPVWSALDIKPDESSV